MLLKLPTSIVINYTLAKSKCTHLFALLTLITYIHDISEDEVVFGHRIRT